VERKGQRSRNKFAALSLFFGRTKYKIVQFIIVFNGNIQTSLLHYNTCLLGELMIDYQNCHWCYWDGERKENGRRKKSGTKLWQLFEYRIERRCFEAASFDPTLEVLVL
jgi:hypothetical protein